jgi:hypothetical protein
MLFTQDAAIKWRLRYWIAHFESDRAQALSPPDGVDCSLRRSCAAVRARLVCCRMCGEAAGHLEKKSGAQLETAASPAHRLSDPATLQQRPHEKFRALGDDDTNSGRDRDEGVHLPQRETSSMRKVSATMAPKEPRSEGLDTGRVIRWAVPPHTCPGAASARAPWMATATLIAASLQGSAD